MSVLVTQQAPDFHSTAVLADGQIVEDFQLSSFKGQKIVLFFYPLDFTFVCPTELGDLADHYEELQKIGVEVYAVSTDTHFTHKAWHDTSETIKKIKFPMIGDPTGAISRNFDVMIEEGLVDEVKSVIGFKHLTSMNTVGYKEIFEFLEKKITLEESIELIKRNTRRYAKRQLTWFRRDKSAVWLKGKNIESQLEEIQKNVNCWKNENIVPYRK